MIHNGEIIGSSKLLCYALRSLPAMYFSSLPMKLLPAARVPTYADTRTWPHLNLWVTHVRRGDGKPFERTEGGRGAGCSGRRCCWRGGGEIKPESRRRERAVRHRGGPFRAAAAPGCSPREDDDEFVSGEARSREEFEVWSAAAEKARVRAGGGATLRGSRSEAGSGGADVDESPAAASAVAVEQVYSARAVPAGIDWRSIVHSVLDQLLFLGFFALLAPPATRAQVRSLFVLNRSGVALGFLGAVPMFVYGLYLSTRRWLWLRPDSARTRRFSSRDEQPNFFGRERQAAKVAAVSVLLAVLVGFSEECVYRGFVPLLLASKTSMPLAAVVVISAVFCGARHAGTLGDGLDAAVLGVYVHGLLLLTGSMLVPVVSHAVFDATLFVAGHLHVNEFVAYRELTLPGSNLRMANNPRSLTSFRRSKATADTGRSGVVDLLEQRVRDEIPFEEVFYESPQSRRWLEGTSSSGKQERRRESPLACLPQRCLAERSEGALKFG